jgi:signal transduction histidine kinase
MNAAAVRLLPYALLLQLAVGLAAFSIIGLWAPQLLLLDRAQARGALEATVYEAIVSGGAALWLSYRRLGRLRFVLRALALGSRAFELEDLAELSGASSSVALAWVGAASAASLAGALPFVRPAGIDLTTAVSLLLFSELVIVALGLPLYALVRAAVSRAIELSPPDLAAEALAILERDDVPRRRVLTHMIAAVVTPIAFVALGAAVVAHAHVRAAAHEAGVATAIALARAAADPLPGAIPLGGRREALRLAAEAGYAPRLIRSPGPFSVTRSEDGKVIVTVPIEEDDSLVEVHFPGSSRVSVAPLVLLATGVVLILALWGGRQIGSLLADDLVAATRQVRLLGNEDVLRGGTRIARPARFEVVTRLGRAMEVLAERFRIFARAQERAIEAREAALRLRGLLFASVSHDLKSPLNAVLGFCALASAEPLSPPQLESLTIIERRGRELLALIETILDAARVEAQQMTLSPSLVSIDEVIARAVDRGEELGPVDAAPVAVDIDPTLGEVRWDDARVAQALAALIGHAKRLSPGGGVRVEARRGALGVEVLVHEPSGVFPVAEVARLLDATNAATAPRRMGGLALGLSLARSLVVLHGGSLDAEPGRRGVIFRVRLPFRL